METLLGFITSFPMGTTVRSPSMGYLYGKVIGWCLPSGWPVVAFVDPEDGSTCWVDEAPGDVEVVRFSRTK